MFEIEESSRLEINMSFCDFEDWVRLNGFSPSVRCTYDDGENVVLEYAFDGRPEGSCNTTQRFFNRFEFQLCVEKDPLNLNEEPRIQSILFSNRVYDFRRARTMIDQIECTGENPPTFFRYLGADASLKAA